MTQVTAVMTAYNAAATIRSALNSVLATGPDDLQVVVVDDGSSDGTAAIVAGIKDARLTLLTPGRLGRPRAFNSGVDAAKGSLIAVTDADDLTLPGRWADQLDYFTSHPDVDVVGGQTRAHEGSARWRISYPTQHGQIVAELDAGRMSVGHPGVMFRKAWFEAAGGLDEHYSRVEDFELYYRLRRSTRFGAVDSDVIDYAFRTLDHRSWTSDRRFFEKAMGVEKLSDSRASDLIGYARYRVALVAQKRGMRLSARAGGRA